jgi:N-dimethylarginine dimethylaminohydrolase
MSRSRGAEVERARAQWLKLYDTLVALGVRVELMTPQPGVPDLVFTANAGLVYGSRFFQSQFRHEVRAREEPFFEAWFREHGYTVEHLPEETYFEGAGDALFCGETLFAGYRIRSDVRGHHFLAEQLDVHVLPMELIDKRYYHLDTCFCPLADGEALWYPPAFDTYGQKVIASHIPKLVEVSDADAERFGCNAVVVGKKVVVNAGCGQLMKDLTKRGYEPTAVELDEFIKAGGSAKCLTIRLDGEDAAGWKKRMV